MKKVKMAKEELVMVLLFVAEVPRVLCWFAKLQVVFRKVVVESRDEYV